MEKEEKIKNLVKDLMHQKYDVHSFIVGAGWVEVCFHVPIRLVEEFDFLRYEQTSPGEPILGYFILEGVNAQIFLRRNREYSLNELFRSYTKNMADIAEKFDSDYEKVLGKKQIEIKIVLEEDFVFDPEEDELFQSETCSEIFWNTTKETLVHIKNKEKLDYFASKAKAKFLRVPQTIQTI